MRQLKMLMLITNSSELLHVLRHWNPNQSVKSCFTWSRHLYQPNYSMTSHFRFNDKLIYSKIIVTFSFTRRPRSFSLGVLKNMITIKIKRFKLVLIIYFIKLKWLQGTDLSHHTLQKICYLFLDVLDCVGRNFKNKVHLFLFLNILYWS